MTAEVRNRIGGELRLASDGGTFERRDPADRRRVVSVAPESTATDVADAVAAAHEACAGWGRTTPTQRADLLATAARALAARSDDIAREMVQWAGNDAKKKAELKEYCKRIVGLGYGTDAAKKALQRLAGD